VNLQVLQRGLLGRSWSDHRSDLTRSAQAASREEGRTQASPAAAERLGNEGQDVLRGIKEETTPAVPKSIVQRWDVTYYMDT